jgi:tetratricopeptide (TPR) repeat protein
LWIGIFLACGCAWAQIKPRPTDTQAGGQPATQSAAQSTTKEEEPPEEDPDLKPKEYSFNPLEAQQSVTAGNFYYKKGNYRAAHNRYLEATKWDPTSGEALLRLAESDEKLHDFRGAREAYTKYLAFDPPPKDADSVKKRLDKLPQDSHAKKK